MSQVAAHACMQVLIYLEWKDIEMAFDGITVAALVTEMNIKLKDARIAKIAQPEADELILTIKTPAGQQRLLISADASLPIAYFTENNKQGPMQAPGFCMLLRKHIQSGRITAVYQPGLERIIMMDIEHLNEMGDLCTKTLVVELMGKHSNIIFCEKDNAEHFKIIDAIKHVSALVSSVREVLPGRDYFIPNTMEKHDPIIEETGYDDFAEYVYTKPMPIAKAIYTSFTGISPIIAQEIVYQAGADGENSTAALTEIEKENIYNQFQYLLRDIKNKSFCPEIIYEGRANGERIPKEFAAIHLNIYENLESEKTEYISELLEKYYFQKNLVTRIRQRSADLRHILTTALERNVKKRDIQEKQLRDTEKKDKYRVYGELINAYGYTVEDGAKSFEALNYYTGENITIPLDPMYSVKDNGRRYFDKYQKLKRTEAAVTELLSTTDAEIEHIDSILQSLQIALKEEDLLQIRIEMEQAGYIKKKAGNKKVKITSKPLHFISSDGYDIYVGKNNLQNDELTFKAATGADWWFHAKKIPGSHVVVKNKGTGEMPDRVYEEAAALAAFYSKGKDQTQVEVDYLQRKNVKKPAGAKPGFVVYYTNFSMMAKPQVLVKEEV